MRQLPQTYIDKMIALIRQPIVSWKLLLTSIMSLLLFHGLCQKVYADIDCKDGIIFYTAIVNDNSFHIKNLGRLPPTAIAIRLPLKQDSVTDAWNIKYKKGETFIALGKPDSAIIFYQNSLVTALSGKLENEALSSASAIVKCFILEGKALDGIKFFNQYLKALGAKNLLNEQIIAKNYLDLYVAVKNKIKAKDYADYLYTQNLKFAFDNADGTQIRESLIDYYLFTGDYKKATIVLQCYEQKDVEGKHDGNLLSKLYYYRYRIKSAQKNWSAAFPLLKKSMEIYDSTFTVAKRRQVEQLNRYYQTKKKNEDLKLHEQNIINLSKQAQLRELNLSQQRTKQKLIIAGLILLILFLLISFNRYRLRKSIIKRLRLQQSEIDAKNRSLIKIVRDKEELLKQKDWLMQEIHHRVKNNLQIVISLLNTQSAYLDNDIAYNAIRESQHRMQSISLIHQKLYQSDSLAVVNLPDYIFELIEYLSDSFDTSSYISFETKLSSLDIEVTKAVPLGLILNEAITNSIKYAFPEKSNGKICITLEKSSSIEYRLTIRDNGKGMMSDLPYSKNNSLGMSLMKGLSKQISGSMSVENEGGVAIIVNFSYHKPTESLVQA
jgi:two-component sensor histidine kinase